MDIKVIVATHKQYRMPSDNCYMPLLWENKGKWIWAILEMILETAFQKKMVIIVN